MSSETPAIAEGSFTLHELRRIAAFRNLTLRTKDHSAVAGIRTVWRADYVTVTATNFAALASTRLPFEADPLPTEPLELVLSDRDLHAAAVAFSARVLDKETLASDVSVIVRLWRDHVALELGPERQGSLFDGDHDDERPPATYDVRIVAEPGAYPDVDEWANRLPARRSSEPVVFHPATLRRLAATASGDDPILSIALHGPTKPLVFRDPDDPDWIGYLGAIKPPDPEEDPVT